MIDPVDVGCALARNRTRSAMTQTQVAELMGTTQSAISRAERGRVMPTVDFIERFARATGRPLFVDFGPTPHGRGPRPSSIRAGDRSRGKPQFRSWELWEMRRAAMEPRPR